MSFKKAFFLLWILFSFLVINTSYADLAPMPTDCQDHNNEKFDKRPRWYIVLERYIPYPWHTIDRIVEKKTMLERIWWDGDWEYKLYMIPKSEKDEDTKNRIGESWIEIDAQALTTLKRNEYKKGFAVGSCFHNATIYHYEIQKNDNWYELVKVWEDAPKNLSYEEKIFGKDYKTYKLLEFVFWYLATIIIETILLRLLIKATKNETQLSNKRIIVTGIVCSWITLPLLWYVLPLIITNEPILINWWEVLVWIIESIIIKYLLNFSRKRAILFSFLCNLATFLLSIPRDPTIDLKVTRYAKYTLIACYVLICVLLYNFLFKNKDNKIIKRCYAILVILGIFLIRYLLRNTSINMFF